MDSPRVSAIMPSAIAASTDTAIQTIVLRALGIDELALCGGGDRLNKHASGRVRRLADAEQGSQRRGHVHRFSMLSIGARLKRQAIKPQRHMGVIAPRRRM